MQSQRETLTDSLANIIQILHIGFRSGTLTAERGEGAGFEEGYIVFVNGRVVDARAGQQRGLPAFNYLKTWGVCRFSLSEVSTEPITTPPPNPTSNPGLPMNNPAGYPPNARNTSPLAPRYLNPLGRGPIRLESGEIALQRSDSSGIHRNHRRLLLLINGQRSMEELARLIGRDPSEVQVWLDELQRAGYIRQ